MAGCIMYFVPTSSAITVGSDPSNKIVVKGLGIPPFLCQIENVDNSRLTGVFAISGFSEGASERFFGGFQFVFWTVFSQFVGRICGEK